ncbi:hypothetical protein ACTFIW_003250 [Dictyostelium discoideum]
MVQCECGVNLSTNTNIQKHKDSFEHHKIMGILALDRSNGDDDFFLFGNGCSENGSSVDGESDSSIGGESDSSIGGESDSRCNLSPLVYDLLLEYIENRINKSSFVNILKILSEYDIKNKNMESQVIPLSVETVLQQFSKNCNIGIEFKPTKEKVELKDKHGQICEVEIEFVDPIEVFELYLKSDLGKKFDFIPNGDHMDVTFSYFFDGYQADSYSTHGLYGMFGANVSGSIERLFIIKIAFLKDSKLIKFNNENIQIAFQVILKSHNDHSNNVNHFILNGEKKKFKLKPEDFFGDIPGLASAFNFGGANALRGACFECHCPNNQMHDISQTFPPKLKEEYIRIYNMKPGEIDPNTNLSKEDLMKINNIHLPMSPILKFPKSIQDLLKGCDWLHIELLGFFKRLTDEFWDALNSKERDRMDYRLLLECLSIAASEIGSERQKIKDFIKAIFLCEQYCKELYCSDDIIKPEKISYISNLCIKRQEIYNSIRRKRLEKLFKKNNKNRVEDERYRNECQKYISRGFIKLHLQKHQLDKIRGETNNILLLKTKSNKKHVTKSILKSSILELKNRLNNNYKFNDNYNETCFFKLITNENFKKNIGNYYDKVIEKLNEYGETDYSLEFVKSIKFKDVKYSINDFLSLNGEEERVWYGQICCFIIKETILLIYNKNF